MKLNPVKSRAVIGAATIVALLASVVSPVQAHQPSQAAHAGGV